MSMSESLGPLSLLLGLVSVALLSGINNGWSLKVGGLVLVRLNPSNTDDAALSMHDEDLILMGGSLVLGMVFGAPASGACVHRVGSRTTSILGECVIIFAVLSSACASSRGTLIALRVLLGVGVGVCITAKPLYIVETCSPAHRGRLLALLAAAIALGSGLCEATGWALPLDAPSWRWLVGLGAIPPSLLLCSLLLLLPQSPVYLSEQSQSRLRAEEQPLAPPPPARGDGKGAALSACHGHWRLLVTLATLVLAKSANGGDVLLVYSYDYLDRSTAGDRNAAHSLGLLVAGVQLVACLVGLLLIDVRWCGRRPLAIWGCVGTTVANLLVAAFWALYDERDEGQAALSAALLLHAAASTSIHIAFYPLTAELLSARHRTTWLGIIYSAAQACSFGTISIGGACEASSLANTMLYFAFALITAASALTLGAVLEETRPDATCGD